MFEHMAPISHNYFPPIPCVNLGILNELRFIRDYIDEISQDDIWMWFLMFAYSQKNL